MTAAGPAGALAQGFTPAEVEGFKRDGWLVVPGLGTGFDLRRMALLARAYLAARSAPLEYEADLKYPGAPASREVDGGRTVRRLLQAYARDAVLRQWATSAPLARRLRQLLGPNVMLSQAHHNCIMTKDPRYSSETGWHQDIRYWAFERPELVSVWLALGSERRENGCLLLLPGTHAVDFAEERFDGARFLRTDRADNRALLQTGIAAELNAGDALFFHCRLLHAAGRNRTACTKYSVVFTYRARENRPLPGTRSAALPEVALAE